MDSIVYGNLRIELLSEHGGRIHRTTARTRPPSIRPRLRPATARPAERLDDREAELAAAHWAAPGSPVGFHAGCGYGKSALLRQLAARSDAGTAVYLGAGGQRLEDLLQLLFDELFLTDGPFKPTPGQRDQLLAQASALVLLDDVTLGPAELRELLDALPGCRLVLSSDRPLLGGLGRSIPLPGLSGHTALALLRRDLGRELTDEEHGDAAALAGILDGQPLHLRQAAALVRSGRHSFAGLARIAEGDVAALGRLSMDELAERERRALGVLAFAAGALLSSELVGALAELTTAEQSLMSLRRRGLAEQEGDRFGLPVCRAGDDRALLLRHLDLGTAARQLAGWLGQRSWTGEEAQSAAGAALKLIRYAAERRQWPTVIRLVDAVEPVLALAGRWEAWRETLEWGLEAARSVADAGAEAHFSHQLGTLEFALDDLERARVLWERALRLREELGDQAGAAVTRANLALLTPVRPGGRRPPRRRPSRRTIVSAALAVLAVLAFLVPLALGDEQVEIPSTTAGATTTSPATTTSTGTTATTAPAGRPVAAVDPAALRFRAEAVGRPTASQPVQVRNTGTAPLPIGEVRLTGADPGDFRQDADACRAGPVAPGGSCLIAVAFQPSATGTRTASLVVEHGAGGSPATVSLSGETPNPPSPSDLTPDPIVLNGPTLFITVRNIGQGDAGPSITRVEFSDGSTSAVETPGVAAGGQADLEAPVPADCGRGCRYTVVVDANDQLQESAEDNNTSSGPNVVE